MKTNAVIVVEGKTDVDFLSSFIDADFVTTNGSAVSEETLDYLTALSTTRDIIILTDPDAPGKRIRDTVSNRIPTAKHAFVPKEKAIRGKKVGIAETDKQTILEALENIVSNSPRPGTQIKASDLFELGLMGGENSAALRNRVSTALHLGPTNAKTFLKRANALGLTRAQLEDAIHE